MYDIVKIFGGNQNPNKMETTENTKLIDKIVGALRQSATEIEELQVQAALGKAEAKEKFEDVKKKFNLFIHESKSKIKDSQEKADEIHAMFDDLRVQLALGKAETTDAFREQKRELLLKLHELEVKIKTNKRFNRIYAFALIKIEEFKVQLQLLEQKFEKGKEQAKVSFEKEKKEFDEYINRLKSKYAKKEETRWEHFQDEVSEAFDHLKKAFSKP